MNKSNQLELIEHDYALKIPSSGVMEGLGRTLTISPKREGLSTKFQVELLAIYSLGQKCRFSQSNCHLASCNAADHLG